MPSNQTKTDLQPENFAKNQPFLSWHPVRLRKNVNNI